MGTSAAQKLYREFLAKAGGEGSRGGKVIGHTNSGKPVYQHNSGHYHPYARQYAGQSDVLRAHTAKHFADYSTEDHHDAAKMHHRRAIRAATKAENTGGEEGHEARRLSESHIKAFEHHQVAVRDAGHSGSYGRPRSN